LEDQLLADVVNKEKPELEETKKNLVKMLNEFKVQLGDLESQLLQMLSEADPNTILTNIPLIDGLENTKATVKDIQKQTVEAELTEKLINESREV